MNETIIKFEVNTMEQKRIKKLNTLTNPDTFWDDVRKMTKNLKSDKAKSEWQRLAENRYAELVAAEIEPAFENDEETTMTFEEFKETIISEIKNFLPAEFEKAKVNISSVLKNNETLSGLTIIDSRVNVSPTIYLESFYQNYQNGNIDDVLREIADVYLEHRVTTDFDISNITDFKKVKDRIKARLLGTEGNASLMEQRPFKAVYEDLAVFYYVHLGEDENNGNMSVPITNVLMESWNVTVEDLDEIAKANADVPIFKGMNEVMTEMMMPQMMEMTGGDEEAAKEMLETMVPPEDKMYVLSNESKLNGATVLLNPTSIDIIKGKLESETFYILPSSIHEVLIVPDETMSADDLRAMVQEVNATQVEPRDRLSDNVYYYNGTEIKIA